MNALQEIFASVLLASRDAAVLAVVIGAILFLFLRRLQPVWRHLLWMLVVLRLILPTLPESGFSWRNWMETTEPAQDATFPFPDGAERFGPVAFPGVPAERTVTFGPLQDVQAPSTRWTLRETLPTVWAIGTLLWLTVMAAGWFQFQRRIKRLERRQHPQRDRLETMLSTLCAEHGINRAPGLILSDAVDGPALTGWRRPCILMPGTAMEGLSPSQLRMVMLHELGHLCRRDVAVNWLLCLLQAAHWFNPVLWWAFRRIRGEAERATDEWVLSRNTADSAGDYGETLICLLESAPHRQHSVPGLIGVLESRYSLRSRLLAIRRYRGQSSPWLMATAVVMMSGVGVVGLTQPPAVTESTDVQQPLPLENREEQLATQGNLDLGDASQVQLTVKVWRTETGRPDELIASPKAVTMLGEWALFEEHHDIQYPTQYDLPVLPEDLAAKAKGGGTIQGNTSDAAWTTTDSSPVLPPHPSGNEERSLGWTLKLRPDRTADGRIQVAGVFDQTGLKGFVNWGVPITVDQASGIFGKTKSRVVAENRQLLPVFLKRKQELIFEPVGKRLVGHLASDTGPSASGDGKIVEGFADHLRSAELPGLRVEVTAKPVETAAVVKKVTGSAAGEPKIYVRTRFFESDLDVSEWLAPSPAFLSDPEFQVVIRALNARKGSDLLSMASLVLDDGETASLEITREFIYAKKYDPPFFPELETRNGFPAAPATPKEFETVPLGVTLQVMATRLPEGLIELDLSPRISDFLELLNFGAPIRDSKSGSLVSENEILQPVFKISNQRMKVQVPDGQTVVFGGFVRDDEQQIEDKVPLIGLVTSSKKVVFRRFVYFFVTPVLMDASGMPVN